MTKATRYNVHIDDSYTYKKKDFADVLEWLRKDNGQCEVFWHRSMFSLKMEWAVHNALFALGYKRERTADVDLNYPCDKPEWLYFMLGMIVWPFIK